MGKKCLLTHWIRVTYKYVSKLASIGSDNGLLPGQRQAIIWTNTGILSIRTSGTKFSEILSEIHTFTFKKMHLKISFAKCRQFCLGLDVLIFTDGCIVEASTIQFSSSFNNTSISETVSTGFNNDLSFHFPAKILTKVIFIQWHYFNWYQREFSRNWHVKFSSSFNKLIYVIRMTKDRQVKWLTTQKHINSLQTSLMQTFLEETYTNLYQRSPAHIIVLLTHCVWLSSTSKSLSLRKEDWYPHPQSYLLLDPGVDQFTIDHKANVIHIWLIFWIALIHIQMEYLANNFAHDMADLQQS